MSKRIDARQGFLPTVLTFQYYVAALYQQMRISDFIGFISYNMLALHVISVMYVICATHLSTCRNIVAKLDRHQIVVHVLRKTSKNFQDH